MASHITFIHANTARRYPRPFASNSQDSSSATADAVGCISRSGNSAGRRSLLILFTKIRNHPGLLLLPRTQASNSKSEIIITSLQNSQTHEVRLSAGFLNPKNVLNQIIILVFKEKTISGLKLLSPLVVVCPWEMGFLMKSTSLLFNALGVPRRTRNVEQSVQV
nr:hypothetical protein Itr_chr01CG05150 [Ipomoea trifida]